MPPDQIESATPGQPDAGGLSPEEMKFFETGDTSSLPAEYAPVQTAPEPAPAPAPAEPPTAPVVAPAPAVDYARLMADQQAAFNRQMEAMNAKLEAATKPPPEPEPDEFTDPIGAGLYKTNKLMQEVTALKTQLTQRQEQEQQQKAVMDFVNGIKADKDAFATTTPDFPKAYEHIRAIRTEDLRMAGCPEADIPQVILQDELQFAQVARQRGQNPAEQMYAMAKRYGYAPQAAAPAAAPPAAAQQAAAAQVQRLQNGQFAAKQPAHAAPGGDAPTLDTLREAGSSDIDKVIMNPDLWETVVGGRAASDIFHH